MIPNLSLGWESWELAVLPDMRHYALCYVCLLLCLEAPGNRLALGMESWELEVFPDMRHDMGILPSARLASSMSDIPGSLR